MTALQHLMFLSMGIAAGIATSYFFFTLILGLRSARHVRMLQFELEACDKWRQSVQNIATEVAIQVRELRMLLEQVDKELAKTVDLNIDWTGGEIEVILSGHSISRIHDLATRHKVK